MKRFLLPILFALGTPAASAAPPNVLFIAIDDLRPQLNCYGESFMLTPNIDRLASRGRLFRKHYVSVPTCGASRYALMTGLRPTAATDNNDAFKYMSSTYPTTPESWVDLLRRNGWFTVSLGKVSHEPDGFRWHYPSTYDIGRDYATGPEMPFSWNEILFGHDKWGAQRYPLFAYSDGTGRVKNVSPAYEIGVDENGDSLPDEAYPDGLTAKAAIEKLREFKDDGTRFCLAVGFFKPHLPFNSPKKYWDLYDPATLPGPDPANKPTGAESATTAPSGEPNAYTRISDRDLLRRAYFAAASYSDAQVGKVLSELDALGLADNTIVVFWGDHGWCLNDYTLLGKHVVLERGVKSPLIVRLPPSLGGDPFAGVPAEGIVETVDIYPTIAELCGLADQVPSNVAGASFVPLLRNPFAPGKDAAYSRWGGVTTVRSPRWRLIRSSTGDDLYDLDAHPYELQDIHASHPEVVTDLEPYLSSQAPRSGTTTYSAWSGADPALADPDADPDRDGAANQLEYLARTDPLDSGSRPAILLSWEDLAGIGLSASEPVYTFTAWNAPDDLRFAPQSSPDLVNWSGAPLVFLDATDLGAGLVRFRFRLADPAERQFFRLETEGD